MGARFILSLVFVLPVAAWSGDRCADELTNDLYISETVALMHIDIRHHEYVCRRDESYLERKKVLAKVDEIYARRASLIRSSQDKALEYLGSEKKFNSYYIASANQISFLFLPNPCERVLRIANAVLTRTVENKKDLHHVYLPYFLQLESDFNSKYRESKFQRFCDKK